MSNILHLEDDRHDAELVDELLRDAGFECTIRVVESRAEFVSAIAKGGIDLIIADYSLPSFDGKSALKIAREKVPDIPFIFFSGTIGEDTAIDSLLNGATDYVLKNRVERFIPAVRRALRELEAYRERRLAQEALREREKRFRQLAENIRDVFWIVEADTGEGIYLSPAYEQIWGRSLQSLHENPREWIDAIHPEDRKRVEEYLVISTKNKAAFEIEYRILRPDGSIRWVHDRAFPVLDELGRVYRIAGVAEDITERKNQEERLNFLAYYDPVTGLPNRTLCFDRLNQQLQTARNRTDLTALMLVDIHRFRIINDTYGRREGDSLLKQVGERLTESFQGAAGLARINADCFALTLNKVQQEAQIVETIEQKVLRAFSRPFKLWGDELRISVKVGIAVAPQDGQEAEMLFRNAEAALLRARGSGEGYLFYALEMNAHVAEKLALENKLRLALEKQQFVLHYQPKVNLRDRQVSGLEALIRWKDPQTGLVPPLKFIPLLEETGLILGVGDWVIRQALADYWQRTETDRHLRIAANVSQVQLRRKDFVDSVRRALADQPGPAPSLDMEITESLIMENIEDNIAKLKALRALGIEIAVDDFGTGYSSLGYLAKLPVNALKIDRSFIIRMTKDPDSMTIVSTIISLAHSLNLKVIAEGVDSEEQAKLLGLLKCDEMQGYLFSKPLPANELTAFLKVHQ